jgi:hypothetical protein
MAEMKRVLSLSQTEKETCWTSAAMIVEQIFNLQMHQRLGSKLTLLLTAKSFSPKF